MKQSVVDYSGKELGEEQIRCRIEELRKLISGDENLPNIRTDDTYLLRFLHATNFNVEEAYERIKGFYEHMMAYPDWFASVSPTERKDLLSHNIKAILPGRDKDGRRIFLTKFENIDTGKVTLKDLVHLDEYWLELVLEEPLTYSKGICCILDANGYSLKMFKWLSPTTIKIGTRKADLYPCKELVYHVVNTSMWVNTSWKFVYPFLNSQTKEKVKFHFNDWNSLHNYVSPEVLPPEYGGYGPPINFEKQNKWFLEKSSEIHQRLHRNAVVRQIESK